MNIDLKYKIAGALIALAVAFASGRYSVHGTTETKKVDTTTNTDKVEHKKIVIEKKPTGETTTTITDDMDTQTKKTQEVTDVKVPVVATKKTLNVSGLAGIDFRSRAPAYGVSVSKEILGPVTVGAFGLTNGTIGVSMGLNF